MLIRFWCHSEVGGAPKLWMFRFWCIKDKWHFLGSFNSHSSCQQFILQSQNFKENRLCWSVMMLKSEPLFLITFMIWKPIEDRGRNRSSAAQMEVYGTKFRALYHTSYNRSPYVRVDDLSGVNSNKLSCLKTWGQYNYLKQKYRNICNEIMVLR